jgi:hypothetical protein
LPARSTDGRRITPYEEAEVFEVFLMPDRRSWLRDFEAGRQLDLVLISAVAAVLLIRFFLAATGYPKIGGDALHIAHMLWGGFLMLAGLIVLLSFMGRGPRPWGAVLGGVGFGTFIDEIGKFITHDNDYFYQPAVALIYAVLVLTYLGARSLHREQLATSRQEYLANAVMELLEVVRGDLDGREQARALSYLDQADQAEPLTSHLRTVLQGSALVPQRPRLFFARLVASGLAAYRRLAVSRWFVRGLVLFFIARFMLDLLRVVVLTRVMPPVGQRWMQVPLAHRLPLDTADYSLAQWLQLGSSMLAGVFVAAGVAAIFRNRMRGLRRFQQSVLVTLLLTQVFVFYQVEWLGLVGLGFNLLVFLALRFVIEQEQDRRGHSRRHSP